ncbi:MAG: OsmC family peroxiredoxin [Kordiimonadaceae bacterium]|nr:OsmC family peroxiredoxin [Kordiimonadaceae bacterium]MBT6034839.1 OsmC family peroxiredoxin [Kordiimonadaceae bacterium]MBT6328901.1 OsmC family peroxiredoxin [Kordiimonadaceae bacterium]MBT7583861.1 OsmC family peroxiredoxin [Kordiimonadaceae bacterium]
MSNYIAKISWSRDECEKFTDQKYSRIHNWQFEGGLNISASPSHHIVPIPYSDPDLVDPEQAFVASISSCHMLFFLDLCSRKKIIVDEYNDQAEGILGKDDGGNMAMTVVTLKPRTSFSGENIPTQSEVEKIHHKAHQLCFIANSVKTKIVTDLGF